MLSRLHAEKPERGTTLTTNTPHLPESSNSIFSEPRTRLKDAHKIGDAALLFQRLKAESLRGTISHVQRDLKGKAGRTN